MEKRGGGELKQKNLFGKNGHLRTSKAESLQASQKLWERQVKAKEGSQRRVLLQSFRFREEEKQTKKTKSEKKKKNTSTPKKPEGNGQRVSNEKCVPRQSLLEPGGVFRIPLRGWGGRDGLPGENRADTSGKREENRSFLPDPGQKSKYDNRGNYKGRVQEKGRLKVDIT